MWQYKFYLNSHSIKPLYVKIILFLGLLLSWFSTLSQVKVRGYYRKNGTYVQPHYRSRPDGNPYNNYSYPGNTNPYTGAVAPGSSSTYSGGNNSRTTYSGSSKTMFVNVDRLCPRFEPSTSSNPIAILNYQNLVEIVSIHSPSWYLIRFTFYDSSQLRFTTVNGYIESAYLSESFPESMTAPKNNSVNYGSYNSRTPNYNTQFHESPLIERTSTYESKSWYVNTDNLKARTSPSNSDNVITTLKFQQPVEYVDVANSVWCEIRFTFFDDTQSKFRTTNGYVERSFLSKDFPESSRPLKKSNLIETKQFYVPSTTAQNTIINPPLYPVLGNKTKAEMHPYGAGNGQLTVWTNCKDCSDITIYINDIFVGILSQNFSNQPDCNAKGIFSTIRPVGQIKITAYSSRTGKKWEGYLKIEEDKCIIQQLSK